LVTVMPAGTTPAALPSGFKVTVAATTSATAACSGDTVSKTVPSSQLNSGKLISVLVGQTIALTLNTRLSPTLGVPGLCGSFNRSACTKTIKSSVLTALTSLSLPSTVSGLLELANRALAGQATGGASASDITDALDSINSGFDECKSLLSTCGS